jgi:two-component system, cell cycle response regulator
LGAPKVLIADDSPLVLRVIGKTLEGAGLRVDTARDGLEAIEKAFSEDYGLVVLDVMMPRMNGYQACRLLKSEPTTRAIPVVILTSKDQPADRFWGLETGADYYVTKDAEPDRILELVKNILAGEAERAPRAARRRTGVASAPDVASRVDVLSRVNELLDRKLYEATVLSEIGRVARKMGRFDEAFASVMTLVSQVVDFTVGGMAFLEGSELEIVLTLNRTATPPLLEDAKERTLKAVASFGKHPSFTRIEMRLLPREGGTSGPIDTTLVAFAAFPIEAGKRLSGVLVLGGRAVEKLDDEARGFLAQVAPQAHIVMENSRLFERVQNLAIRDSLTGLFNHRHTIELLAREVERAGRYAVGVSALMIDIDHFKTINDQHGHLAGDAVLREVARLLRDALRTVDSVGRYGGEEFLVLLPHTPPDEALRTAERLRRSVEEHAFRAGKRELRVTISVGVATWTQGDVPAPEALIREADQALYRAKGRGRNQVAGDR